MSYILSKYRISLFITKAAPYLGRVLVSICAIGVSAEVMRPICGQHRVVDGLRLDKVRILQVLAEPCVRIGVASPGHSSHEERLESRDRNGVQQKQQDQYPVLAHSHFKPSYFRVVEQLFELKQDS